MSAYIVYVGDTETTGTNPLEHEVIEVSLSRLSFEKNLVEEEQKTWYLKALKPQTIQQEALNVNGHKREDILWMTKEGREKYKEPHLVIPEIEMWMMEDNSPVADRVFVGRNPKFDMDMMTELWRQHGNLDTFPFACDKGYRMLDVGTLALIVDLCTNTRRQYYNLSSLIDDFGVKKGKAHKAAEDVRMTKDLLKVILCDEIVEFIGKKFIKGN